MSDLPDFLSSYIQFRQHIEQLYEDASNVEKGRFFANLVKDTLNSHEDFFGLEATLNAKETYDEGVDIFWRNSENQTDMRNDIFCQCKFKIKGKDELDNVISKFKSIEEKESNQVGDKNSVEQLNLLSKDTTQGKTNKISQKVKYIIVTLWQLDSIVNNYENSYRPSLEFYHKILQENRLEVIDGNKLYEYFLSGYQKEYATPQEVRFKSDEKLIGKSNVYVGIISATDLIEIYNKSRNGIFFENVRDFLGMGSKDSSFDINSEIYKTARDEPVKMIERNNGITFKASSINYEGEYVVLKNAGIINGCQTTLCIYKAEPNHDCFVPVKIVITNDEQNSSDIARTANTQNRIDKINLELSDFIRPQLVKLSLAEIGLDLYDDEASKSAPFIAAVISKQKIFKSDLRFLFIGLFSASPRNIFKSDYANIRFEEIRSIFQSADKKKSLNSLLARLIICSNNAFERLRYTYPPESKNVDLRTPEEKIGKVFNRFYIDQKGYKSYLTVLSIYCLLKVEDEKKIKTLKIDELVRSIENIVESRSEELEIALQKVFKSVAMSVINHFSEKGKDFESKDLDNEVSQYLSQYVTSTSLAAYYMNYALM